MLLAMIWSAGWAQTTVEQTVFTATSSDNIGGDKNVSFSCDKGGGTADPNTKSNMIQLYQIDSKSKIGYGNTITISIEKGYEINSVTIGTNKESSVAYTLDSETTLSATTKVNANKEFSVTELSANSITFYCMGTAKENRFMVNKLSVTYSATGSSNKTATSLKFPQDAFTYATIDNYLSFTGQVATLTSEGTALTGKTITYSKSGDDIFSSFDTTNGTLALNGNPGKATVTATFAGDETYASSSASYTISVKEVVKDIATLKPLLTSSFKNFTLKLTDAIVTYKSGDVLYIQDNTAGIYCSGSTTLDNNDKVNGLVEIKARIYNGQSTITQWTLAEDATIDHNVEFTPEVVTLAELNANIDKYENMRVKVVGATATAAMTNNQTTITQGDASLLLYSKAKSINWDFEANDVLDIEGYPITYNNSKKELLVYRKGDVVINSSVVATTLSFDTEKKEFSVEKNSETSFTAPTATVKDAVGEVVEGAKITYTSSKPNIASVDDNGIVTFGSEFGTAIITASYAGDATHKPAESISYTITYSKIPTVMAWSQSSVSVNLGEENTFTAPTLTFTAHDMNILEGKTIQYNSSDENVAMIDETGIVLMGKAGSAKISATFAGDDTYTAASAEYTLNVIDPNKTDVTFDFTKPEDYGYDEVTSGFKVLDVDAKIQSRGVVITNVKNGSTSTRFSIKNASFVTFRVYKNAILTVEAPAGFAINKIDFTDNGSNTVNNFNFSTGKLSSKTWTGLAETLTMEVASNQVFLEKMTVNLVKVENITLDESADNTIEAKTGVNVTLKRSMVANEWNTICLPFDVTEKQAKAAFGDEVKIVELDTEAAVDANVLSFKASTVITAATPYLIKPSAVSETGTYTFDGVDITETNDKYAYSFNNVTNPIAFKGIFNMVDITKDVDNVGASYYAAFLGDGNKIYKAGTGKTKGFRAYFAIPNSASASALRVVIDGTATSIKNIDSEVVESNAPVYNLQGQRVDGNNLTPGIYVKAGKKFVVK